MASDVGGLLRQLKKRGYAVPGQVNGKGHIEIWRDGTMVTTVSGTRTGGRTLANLKADIRKFEESRPTRTRHRPRKGKG